MSDNTHHVVIVIQALALYAVKGVAIAAAWLMSMGWTSDEAYQLFEEYENARDKVLAGQIP